MGETDWKEQLPEDLRADPTLKDIKDVGSLAKSLIETKKFVGSSLRIPGQEAGPEARTEFLAKLREKVPELLYVPADPEARKGVEADLWTKLGRPEKPEDYSLEGVQVEEGVTLPAEKLRELGKALGLTQAQLREAARIEAEGLAQQVRAVKDAKASLRAEYGDEYQTTLERAATTAEAMGFPEDAAALRSGAVPAARAKAWVAAARKVTGPGNVVGQQGSGGSGPEPTTELLAQREEIMRRPEYWNPRQGPDTHKRLVQKVLEINDEIARRSR